ncbi:beta-barrel assembly-enhancing protease [mine drainage metagenome]|uniref:Beta-barrel assembly-enhancing protease n=1 Tax=mine drainage metagenome TaxID=410659 RepID=A0A1J5SA80_9ZZZZ
MSLINQMLKDLEHRGAGSTDTAKLSSTPLITNNPPSRSFPWIKISLLIILLAGGIYYWMQFSPTSSLKTNINQTISNTISTETKLQAVVESTTPTTVAPATPVVEPATAEPVKAKAVSLFETELKYTPSDFQEPSTKIQKDKTKPNSPSTQTTSTPKQNNTDATNSTINSNEAEKALPPKHTLSKLPTKLNSDASATGKEISPTQKSGNYYRLGILNLQQGRVSEAQANLLLALDANPENQDARQALAGLLLDNKRNDEAKTVLAAGLAITPEQSDFRMALARLQVEAGDKAIALSTLEQGLPYAKTNAIYQSFIATLLQRADRHEEAITHYMTALSLNSATTSTLIGLGISLQAVGKLENAKEAFTRAQTSAALTPELSAFVEQRLKQINQHLRN